MQPGGAPSAPAVYAGKPREILGTEPMTFFMLGTAVLLLLTFLYKWDLTWFAVLEVILTIIYWKFK